MTHQPTNHEETTMSTYYAVCNANGPISVRLDAGAIQAALEEFDAADTRTWIDDPRMDAEDELDIAGEGMSEEEFGEALELAGLTCVHDCSQVVNAHAGTVAHLRHIEGVHR